MEKTKLGISVGLMAAVVYLLGLYSGYMVTILAVGYILLAEENEWLKKSAVKAVVLMLSFSVVTSAVYFLPSVWDFLCSIMNAFGAHVHADFLSGFTTVMNNALYLAEQVLFILLGLMALKQKSIAIPALDSFVEKYL
jgi:uncharacterized membrane protein